MQQVLSQWLRYDPDGAAAGIIKQEPSPKLDSSIRTHAYQFAHRNPGYAISWAESISNTQQRGQTVKGEWE